MTRLLESIGIALVVFMAIGAVGVGTAILFEISVTLGMVVVLSASFILLVASIYSEMGKDDGENRSN